MKIVIAKREANGRSPLNTPHRSLYLSCRPMPSFVLCPKPKFAGLPRSWDK